VIIGRKIFSDVIIKNPFLGIFREKILKWRLSKKGFSFGEVEYVVGVSEGCASRFKRFFTWGGQVQFRAVT